MFDWSLIQKIEEVEVPKKFYFFPPNMRSYLPWSSPKYLLLHVSLMNKNTKLSSPNYNNNKNILLIICNLASLLTIYILAFPSLVLPKYYCLYIFKGNYKLKFHLNIKAHIWYFNSSKQYYFLFFFSYFMTFFYFCSYNNIIRFKKLKTNRN